MVQAMREEASTARRRLAERPIVTRRTWAFPLFPREMLDALALDARYAARSTGSVRATAHRAM